MSADGDTRRFSPSLSRRTFMGGALVLVCAPPALLAACSAAPAGRVAGAGDGDGGPGEAGGDGARSEVETGPSWAVPAGSFLDPDRYRTLAALFDALIPGSDSAAGATIAGAAWYLDQLLGAFAVEPPRIYAGGPYSGRHGGLDGFSQFQRLTRVEEIRWRTWIEGSRGLPEREFNGPVKGLQERYREGLEALDVLARRRHQSNFASLPLQARRGLLLEAGPEFVTLAYQHAVEGTYGDPVYGGNRQGEGWAAIDFEGDRQPRGYTARQMAHPEEG